MPEDEQEQPTIEPVDMPEPPDWNWQRPANEPAKGSAKGPDPVVYSRGMGIAFAIGTSFLGPVLGGLLLGYLIDGKVGGTWGIVGLLLGTIAAFVLLIRLVNKLNEDG